MNLLQLLLSTLTSQSSVNTVSKKTGVNSKLTSKLLLVAIPLLIKYMTKNASKKTGAQSLLSALGQHTSTQTMTQQLQNADQNDGSRIINHILGKDKDTVVNSLASETGLSNNQVNSTLSTIAPALLSGLSAATTQAQNQSSGVNLADGLDFGDLMAFKQQRFKLTVRIIIRWRPAADSAVKRYGQHLRSIIRLRYYSADSAVKRL